MTLSERQKEHYDQILDEYDAHYFDPTSITYRRKFIYEPLFSGIPLAGKRVADMASGSGHNSMHLIEKHPGIDVLGLDISDKACQGYERNVGTPCYNCDLTAKDAALPAPVDVAFIIGGLHHCVADLENTFKNLEQLIKPGGWLLMVEPNAGFFLNFVRNIWYRKSRYFDHMTERPLYHSELIEIANDTFEPKTLRYMGGLGYFLILNSLMFHLPISLKKFLAPPTMLTDTVSNTLNASFLHPYFIAQWQKKEK